MCELEDDLLEQCPQCERYYNEIDAEYQLCSKCGWDAERKEFNDKAKVEPTEADYLNGDADILTRQWY